MSEPTPKRRRFLQFGLRFLLLVVTLVGIWLGLKVPAARQQRAVVQTLQNSGAWSVDFDYEQIPVPGQPNKFDFDKNALPPGPKWLREFIGEDYFRTVIGVQSMRNRTDPGIPEAEYALLGTLPELRVADLMYAKIVPSNSGAERRLNDADIAFFARNTRLESLGLFYADIDGSGLAALVNLKNLKMLFLGSTHISDLGMQQIGKLTSLEVLYLRMAHVSEESLKHLENLTNLEELDLRNNDISDASLKNLKKLTALKFIGLGRTKVTPEGIEELKKAFPKITIL